MICDALIIDKIAIAETGHLTRRRCRKRANGRIGGLCLCSRHIGMLFLYGDIDAECDEPGHVRRLTIASAVERIEEV